MKTAKQLVDELSAAGLSQGDIARKTGIRQATISRIKAGVSEGRISTWQRLNELAHPETSSNKCSSSPA